MEISTYELWLVEEQKDQKWCALSHPEGAESRVKEVHALEQERVELHARFPYARVAAGSYVEHDYAERWCWQNIGPANGECRQWHSEYPACPLVLATEHIEPGERQAEHGKMLSWESKRYLNPGKHEHQGKWSFLWFGKTDYDYGYAEYCFSDEADFTRFQAAFPTFTWAEDWDK